MSKRAIVTLYIHFQCQGYNLQLKWLLLKEEVRKKEKKREKKIFIECLLCYRHTILMGNFLSIPTESYNSDLQMRLKRYRYNMSNPKLKEVEELKIFNFFLNFVLIFVYYKETKIQYFLLHFRYTFQAGINEYNYVNTHKCVHPQTVRYLYICLCTHTNI